MFYTSNNYTISNIELYIRIGVTEEERADFQKINISIQAEKLGNVKACQTDDIKDAVCYKAIIGSIKEKFEIIEVALIERLAQLLYDHVRSFFDSNFKLIITVQKSPKIYGFSGEIFFTIKD